MDDFALLDRRRLRSRLAFWRFAAIAIALIAVLAAVLLLGSSSRQAVPHVARVTISGLIQDDRELLERLDAIEKSDAVKALVVSISSPGGTTYGGEAIYKALRRISAKKPVVADIRTLAASAGYMIAIGADHIVAGETSITGSIGVIFQYPQIKPLLDKLGVSLEEIKSAPLKAEPSPFHPASPEAQAMIKAMIDDSFGWFVDRVAERRGMDPAAARQLADGRILTGRQAKAAGLVDELGGDPEIKAYLETRKIDKELPLIEWRAPSTGLPFGLGSLADALAERAGSQFFQSFQGIEKHITDKLFLDGMVSVWQVEPR